MGPVNVNVDVSPENVVMGQVIINVHQVIGGESIACNIALEDCPSR